MLVPITAETSYAAALATASNRAHEGPDQVDETQPDQRVDVILCDEVSLISHSAELWMAMMGAWIDLSTSDR